MDDSLKRNIRHRKTLCNKAAYDIKRRKFLPAGPGPLRNARRMPGQLERSDIYIGGGSGGTEWKENGSMGLGHPLAKVVGFRAVHQRDWRRTGEFV